MPISKPIAYAVDIDSGKITWCLYDEPQEIRQAKQANEKYCLKLAMASLP